MYLNTEDCWFIFEETWRSRSALCGSVNDRLMLTRWDQTKPCDYGNVICLTKSEHDKHVKLHTKDFSTFYSKTFLDYVESRFKIEASVLSIRV